MATELTGRVPPAARPPRAPRRWHRIAWRALQGSALLAALLFVWCLIAANPSFPDSPELRAVSLALPKAKPASKPLDRFLRTPGLYRDKPDALDRAKDALSEGRWPDDLREIADELERLEPSLAAFRAAVLAPGCLPTAGFSDSGISYLGLFLGARYLAVEAVLASRRGEPDRAVRDLLRMLARLAELERCAPNLLAAMVLSSSIAALHNASGFALANPRLDRRQVEALLARSSALSTRPNPMPDALRQEAEFRKQVIALFRTEEPEARQPFGKQLSAPRAWPWYDEEQTLALSATLARRHVLVAGMPPSSPGWKRLSPEEEYFERLQEAPAALALLRFNGLGKAVVALATPLYRHVVLKWHQERCLLAAHRGRWIADLRQRSRALPQGDPLRDPFTGKRFRPEIDGELCGAPADDRLPEPARVRPLPPPPPEDTNVSAG